MNKKIIIPANTLKKGDTIEIKTEMFDPTVDNQIIIKEVVIKKKLSN
jgi:hypothetical protein